MAKVYSAKLSAKERAQGIKTGDDKGVVVAPEDRMPYSPQYAKMTKAEFVQAEKERMEKKQAMKQFAREYDEKQRAKKQAPVSPPEPEPANAEAPKRKGGRPKKAKDGNGSGS